MKDKNNQFKQVWGTCNFPSHEAALRYYKGQFSDTTKEEICSMVKSGEISIGRPKAKENETVFLNTEEERYFVGVK